MNDPGFFHNNAADPRFFNMTWVTFKKRNGSRVHMRQAATEKYVETD
jgi:hypothetical protein